MVISRLKPFCYKLSGPVYCVFLLLMYAFTFTFAVESHMIRIILIALYFAISAFFLIGMYKSVDEVANVAATFLLLLLLLPLVFKPLLLIPLPGLIIIFFKYKKWRIIRYVFFILCIVLYCIAGLIGYLAYVFSGFGSITELQKIPSPDGQYVLIVQESDQGALGGSVSAFVEKNVPKMSFIGIAKRMTDKEVGRKRLYYGYFGEKPNLSWINTNEIRIYDRVINIFDYAEWINKK